MANEDFMRTVYKNLPGIFTAGSIITGVLTAGLALYEGYKLCEDWDEDAETKEKVKIIARRIVPVLLGATASASLCYAAHHESTKRIAAVSAAVAAAKLDTKELDEFKNKAKEMIGVEQVEKVEKAVKKEAYQNAPQNIVTNEWIGEKWVYDKNTGYMWKTSFDEFLDNMHGFNRELSMCYGDKPITDFYSMFPQGVEEVAAFDYIRFSNDKNLFAPRVVGSRLLPNMDSALEIDYEYNGLYD